jgi:hypothetical protein
MKIKALLVLVVVLLAALPSCSPVSAGMTPTPVSKCAPDPYCMSIVAGGNVVATPTPSGFNYSGTLTFSFDPAIPSGMGVSIDFNGSSMSGTATGDGNAELRFSIGGSSSACQMVNPTSVVAFRAGSTQELAFTTMTWTRTGCQ